MTRVRRAMLACLIMALFLGVGTVCKAEERRTASPDQLRALYIQRLVKYVTWPKGAGPANGEPFVVAATDPDRLRPYFNTPSAKARFKLVQWPAPDAHILVLAGAPDREAAAILSRVTADPVLTISQNPVNLRQGVVVNFYMKDGRLKLEVNPKAAETAGLTVSSRLLKLARIYRGSHE